MKIFQLFSLVMSPACPTRAPRSFGHLKLVLLFCLLMGTALCMGGCSLFRQHTTVAESAETIDNWSLARRYQAQGRFELARQHYGLAMATVRTQSALDVLKREIIAVDMQLRAMR